MKIGSIYKDSKTKKEYKKVSRTIVKKEILENGIFKGFIVGNKVNPSHFFEGWHLATLVEIPSLDDFEKKDNSALYYLEKELGTDISYYKEL